MEVVITDDEIKDISYELKQIYYSIVIEQEFEMSNNVFADTVLEVVERNNKLLQDFTVSNKGSSFSINFDEELVHNFFNRKIGRAHV